MSTAFTVRRVDAGQLAAQADQLEPLYRQCFAGPPWNETPQRLAEFQQRLAVQFAHPAAGGLTADDDNGQLLGAIYGWPAGPQLPTETDFDRAVAAAATAPLAVELTAPSLIIAELMVHPHHRRRGIARQLLTEYTAGWPSAWLCTHPDAPAAHMYDALGWRRCVQFQVADYPLVLFTYNRRDQDER